MDSYYISIWNACNLRCKFCYNDLQRDSRQFFRPYTDIVRELLQINNKNTHIIIVWWEPLLYPHIFDLLDKIESLWFCWIWLVTNGICLDNDWIIERLLKYKSLSLEVSIHSDSEHLEASVTQRSNNFLKKERGILRLLALKKSLNSDLYIHVNTVANRYNIEHLSDVIKYTYNLWLKNISLSCIYNLWWFSETNLSTVVKYSEILREIVKISSLLDWNKLNLKVNWLPLCFHKNESLLSLHYKIRELDCIVVDDNDGEGEKKKFKITTNKCNNCYAYKRHCNWIFDFYLREYSDSEFVPLTKDDIILLNNKNSACSIAQSDS